MLIPYLQNHCVIRKGSRLLLDSHTTTASVMLTNGDNLNSDLSSCLSYHTVAADDSVRPRHYGRVSVPDLSQSLWSYAVGATCVSPSRCRKTATTKWYDITRFP